MGVLAGRTAIATGGARDIGGAIARRFAAEGAAVVVNDLDGGTDGTRSDVSAEGQARTRSSPGRAACSPRPAFRARRVRGLGVMSLDFGRADYAVRPGWPYRQSG